MKPLPLPLRVAAGLAVTAVDRARQLPEKLAELPVTVVSQALQLSMRVQQQVTELAIKGDDALSSLRPVEEKPEWATFDEDKAGANYDATPVWGNGQSSGTRSAFDRAELTEDDAIDVLSDDSADAAEAPEALPIYAELTLAQVRARLRRFDEDQLAELIDFEERHGNRPEFVGMLTRRLNTLRDQQ
ncbi:MAG TPA: lipid droplet-associated protein [Pseudonocardiaceae bacterium]|nr:lipid droplet-associated protein [Pseudonocardiaceae bacterium]